MPIPVKPRWAMHSVLAWSATVRKAPLKWLWNFSPSASNRYFLPLPRGIPGPGCGQRFSPTPSLVSLPLEGCCVFSYWLPCLCPVESCCSGLCCEQLRPDLSCVAAVGSRVRRRLCQHQSPQDRSELPVVLTTFRT